MELSALLLESGLMKHYFGVKYIKSTYYLDKFSQQVVRV